MSRGFIQELGCRVPAPLDQALRRLRGLKRFRVSKRFRSEDLGFLLL